MIGESAAHDSALKHVTGEAQYVDDLAAVYQPLYVAVGCAEIACGRVLQLNLDAVRCASGVVDVITSRDIPGHSDIGAVFPGDPLLIDDEVEFYGQALFAVLASSQQQARAAVGLADIEYRQRQPVLDIEEAIAQEYYVRPPYSIARGDVAQAFEQPHTRLQSTFRVGGQEHFYLEGQVALALAGEDGTVTVHSSNQNPTEAQKLLAEVLALPMNAVTVETRRMGGGFGGKETQASACCCLAALFALRQQRAVLCRLSRRDDMILTGKRHPFLNRYDVSLQADGRIAAARYQLAGQCGNSPDLSDAIVDRAMLHCDNAYYFPAIEITGLRCKTNTVSNTAFRGFGGPQGLIAAEALMDEIAFVMQQDPLAVRRHNLYSAGRDTTPYGQQVETQTLPKIIDQLEHESDYQQRRADIRQFNASSRIIKKGIALTPVKFGISFTAIHLNQGGALLQMYSDGTVLVNHGGTEMGQGLFVKVAQIVAAELGVAISAVRASATRTDKVPNTSPTAASSGTDINGMAALAAARTLKQRLVSHAAAHFGCDPEALRFDARGVRGAEQQMSWAELAQSAWMARVSLSATGYYKTPDIHFDRAAGRGRPFYYYANGAAVSEVLIDTLTGECRVTRADIVHDVGRSINPAIDIGQIEGGYIQGLGWLTTEELVWDKQGRLTTDGPATYKIPAISDTPATFNVRLLEDSPNAEATVFRSKAVGEPPLMLAVSAWCAIRDAIAAVDDYQTFPRLNAPATAEEILRCIDSLTNP